MNQFPRTMAVRTSNGVEMREVDYLQCAATSKKVGIHASGLTSVPKLKAGEEIRWCSNGECHVIVTHDYGRIVTGLRYDYDGQLIMRVVEYSDGTSYETQVAQMPTREEFEAEKELLNVFR